MHIKVGVSPVSCCVEAKKKFAESTSPEGFLAQMLIVLIADHSCSIFARVFQVITLENSHQSFYYV